MRDLLDDGLRYEKAGMLDRALEQYEAALEATGDAALISETLRRLAHVHRMRCDWNQAIEAATRSAAVAHAAGSLDLAAEAWNAEAAVHQSRGDFDAALVLYERMLELSETGRIRGVALQNLATIHARRGQLDEAEKHLRQAHAAFETAGYRWGVAHVLNNLSGLALDRGDASAAEAAVAEAIGLALESQDLELVAIARINYAEALLARGEFERAELEASASLGHFVSAGNEWRRIDCLRLLGDIAHHRQQLESSRRFYEAALDAATAIGASAERELLLERLAGPEGTEAGVPDVSG